MNQKLNTASLVGEGIAAYMEKLADELKKTFGEDRKRSFLIYRGVPCEAYKVESAASRRLGVREDPGEYLQVDTAKFISYHQELIQKAKNLGYGNLSETGKEKNDLQMLADIQHYGGATCLTDFTTNFLTALWFASLSHTVEEKDANGTEYKKETDGKVYIVDVESTKSNKEHDDICNDEIICIIDESRNDEIGSLLRKRVTRYTKKYIPRFWLWKPSRINSRIYDQDSVFLFGVPKFSYIVCAEVIVLAKDKKTIRDEMKKYFSMDAASVFGDLPGYSREANSSLVEVCRDMRCVDYAMIHKKKGEYDIAIDFFDKEISCLSGAGNAHCETRELCMRERSGSELGNSLLLAEAYYWRGVSYSKRSYCGEDESERKKRKEKFRDMAFLDFDRAVSYFVGAGLKHSNNNFKKQNELLCRSIQGKLAILYNKSAYAEALDVCENPIKCIKNNTECSIQEFLPILNEYGRYIYLEKAELFVLTCKKGEVIEGVFEQFKEHVESLFKENEFVYAVLGVLEVFYKWALGQLEGNSAVFCKKIEELSTKDTKNLSKTDMYGVFPWDFDDMRRWAEDQHVPYEGLLLIKEMERFQYKIKTTLLQDM